MNPLFDAGLELQRFMQEQQWSFCFIGGLAVIRWGEVRMTRDIDISLLSELGTEEKYVDVLCQRFEGRIPDAHAFALANRVLLLSASNGVDVDVSLSGFPFEEEMIRRATPFEFAPGCSLVTCSAEDLIVLKAFADRPLDWHDAEGVIARQRDLDTRYIMERLAPLCEIKDAPQILDRLRNIISSGQEGGVCSGAG